MIRVWTWGRKVKAGNSHPLLYRGKQGQRGIK